jgi:hypothetical protein
MDAARVASQTSGGSRMRSRSTCQRSVGSESSSHAIRASTSWGNPSEMHAREHGERLRTEALHYVTYCDHG